MLQSCAKFSIKYTTYSQHIVPQGGEGEGSWALVFTLKGSAMTEMTALSSTSPEWKANNEQFTKSMRCGCLFRPKTRQIREQTYTNTHMSCLDKGSFHFISRLEVKYELKTGSAHCWTSARANKNQVANNSIRYTIYMCMFGTPWGASKHDLCCCLCVARCVWAISQYLNVAHTPRALAQTAPAPTCNFCALVI